MRRRRIWTVVLFLGMFATVKSVFNEGLNENIAIQRSEGKRRYDLYIPVNVTSNPALLLSLHASGSDKITQSVFSKWDEWAERYKTFIVAWPQGFGGNFNAGGYCCGGAGQQGIDDRGFIKALIQDVNANTTIDNKRVYLTGYSNGGTFSQWMAYKETNLVTAAVAMAVGFRDSMRDEALSIKSADPASFRSVPIFLIHGYRDMLNCSTKYFCFGWKIFHIYSENGMQNWASVHNCTGEPTTIAENPRHFLNFLHKFHSPHYDYQWIKAYQQCDDGAEVRQLLNSRTHAGEWFGGNGMKTQSDYNDRILTFLFNHTLP